MMIIRSLGSLDITSKIIVVHFTSSAFLHIRFAEHYYVIDLINQTLPDQTSDVCGYN